MHDLIFFSQGLLTVRIIACSGALNLGLFGYHTRWSTRPPTQTIVGDATCKCLENSLGNEPWTSMDHQDENWNLMEFERCNGTKREQNALLFIFSFKICLNFSIANSLSQRLALGIGHEHAEDQTRAIHGIHRHLWVNDDSTPCGLACQCAVLRPSPSITIHRL